MKLDYKNSIKNENVLATLGDTFKYLPIDSTYEE